MGDTAGTPLLRLQGVSVAYGDVPVLRDVSLDVHRREIVSVIGPNGAGKTTLLNAVIGFQHPHAGTILYRGEPVDRIPPEKMVRLGMTIVPEGARVFAEMSVLDNLKMGSYVKSARALRQSTLDRVFTLFPRLRELQHRRGGTLSGGERQMLAIGRALMSNPELLLLDEPSLGLQPLLVTRVFEAVRDIARSGVTVLLVEQNVHLSLGICHRAYVLEGGRIVLEGAGEELIHDEHVRRAYLAL